MQTSYKETIAARGVLEPTIGTQKIRAPATARVKDIRVKLGDAVERGDILASLSTAVFDQQGAPHDRDKIKQLESDRDLLAQQYALHQQVQQQSRLWNELVSARLHASTLSLQREAGLLLSRTQVSDRSLQAFSKLHASGNSSDTEYDRQQLVHLELLGQQQSLEQRQLQTVHELNALSHTERLGDLEFEEASLQYERELHAIEQEIHNLENQTIFTVIADAPGVVAELGLELGKSVMLNQTLFYINPLHSELQATIYVPAMAQGKLTKGQAILLRYDAFDYRFYGRYAATVTSVGQAHLDLKDTPLPVVGVSEPVFKISASLDKFYIENDKRFELQSGMTLSADFVISEMSLLQLIVKPLLALQGKVSQRNWRGAEAKLRETDPDSLVDKSAESTP